MDLLARSWGMWVLRGIASILFGVLTVVWPDASIAALVLIFGVYAFVDGAVLLGLGLLLEGRKAPYIVRGLLSIAAGVVTFVYPGLTALSLYVLVGVWKERALGGSSSRVSCRSRAALRCLRCRSPARSPSSG